MVKKDVEMDFLMTDVQNRFKKKYLTTSVIMLYSCKFNGLLNHELEIWNSGLNDVIKLTMLREEVK